MTRGLPALTAPQLLALRRTPRSDQPPAERPSRVHCHTMRRLVACGLVEVLPDAHGDLRLFRRTLRGDAVATAAEALWAI